MGPDIYTVDDHRIETVLYAIATVVASMLPIMSVVVLYFVQSNNVRLGLTVAFSACFAILLVCLTNAKKVEVFTATAAYVPQPPSLAALFRLKSYAHDLRLTKFDIASASRQ